MLFKNIVVLLSIALVLLATVIPSYAGKYALVLACRAGNAQLHQENRNNTTALIKFLNRQKFTDINVFFEGGGRALKASQEINRAAIVKKLTQLGKQLKSSDQFWLFLLGHATASPRRVSLATKKGRLTGRELATLLDKIRAEQFLFCLNTQSYGLMALLAKPNRVVLCATDSYDQLNPPRFTKIFINSLLNSPQGNLLATVKQAGKLTDDFYTSNQLASAENSQLYYQGEYRSYPFDGSEAQWLPKFLLKADSSTDDVGTQQLFRAEVADIKIHPATPASKAQLAAAKQQAANYAQYAAVYLKRDTELTLKLDNSSTLLRADSIYINREAATELFGSFKLPFATGSTSKIIMAKIIYPDGSYADFKGLAKAGMKIVTFSGLRRGCLLLKSSLIDLPASTQLADYSKRLRLQSSIPTVTSQVKIAIPRNTFFRYKLYNASVKPQISQTEYSKIYLFKFGLIPAYSYLPGDPEPDSITMALALSTMQSWQQFTLWAERMFHRADKIDKTTENFLNKLVAGSKDDTEKVKRIYDYLCGLRYLTVPVGAGAFRPRQPSAVVSSRYGDCKDKANALVVLAGYIGIKGYRVLLNRHHWFDKAFPAWQFNHMIAYFPKLTGYPDGIWLDATDGSTRFGTLPPGDIGRTGMLIKDKRFKFKSIEFSGRVANSIKRHIKLKLLGDGSLAGEVKITVNGLPDYKIRQKLKHLSPRQLKLFINDSINDLLPGFSVKKFIIKPELYDISQPLNITIEVVGARWMLKSYNQLLGDKLWQQFSLPQRRYGIVVNERQPLFIEQDLTLSGLPSAPKQSMKRWQRQTKYITIKFSTEQTMSLKQHFEIKFNQGIIPADKYQSTRAVILKFMEVKNESELI
jgi:hypothetical protein